MAKILQRTRPDPGEVKTSNLWRTDPECFRALDREFKFSIDLAANAIDRLCNVWLGPGGVAPDALDPAVEWVTIARSVHTRAPSGFLNPPYSADLVKRFMFRARFEAHLGLTIVALVPDTHDTGWYRALDGATEIRRIPHRIAYLKADGVTKAGAMFPSCVAIFRPGPVLGPPRIVSWTWRTSAL